MGKINVYNKIVLKKRKKGNMEIEDMLYINHHLKKILKWNLQLDRLLILLTSRNSGVSIQSEF